MGAINISQWSRSVYLIVLFITTLVAKTQGAATVLLAKDRTARVSIVLPAGPSVTQRFAAAELSRYLAQITGASFRIGTSSSTGAIVLNLNMRRSPESYSISVTGNKILLNAGSDRALLYAVYDLLSRLGCCWLAPGFSFYKGAAEYVPHQQLLYYRSSGMVDQRPAFTYRKLDVEEGQTHNIENLKQLIDWMPKLRFNTLMIPVDYQGAGRVKWDKWRDELTPELKKRGLLIEVGGHGYQNYMNAGMDNGNLFTQHPDWFGKNKDCKPDKAEYLVFNTSNNDAVHYFTNSILNYLKQHPEIDIFDLWPPDGAHWADCPDWQKWGSPEDRQAQLLASVDPAVKAYRPDLRLEIIAYAKTISPPQNATMDKRVLVDICPIDQNFETQIFDTTAAANVAYVKAIKSWRQKFGGDLGLYSYFRKYAWKSLPNVIPHYMQRDVQWYAKVPLQGITTYAEPGDWYTYELGHYIFGQLAWDPTTNVDQLIAKYCRIRYGTAGDLAGRAYAALENNIRIYGSIRNSTTKLPEAIGQVIGEMEELSDAIQQAKPADGNALSGNFDRLLLMLEYAITDLKIRKAIAEKQPKEMIQDKVATLLQFLKEHQNEGTFVLSAESDLQNLMRYNYR